MHQNQNIYINSPSPPNLPQTSNSTPFIASLNIPPPPPILPISSTSHLNPSNPSNSDLSGLPVFQINPIPQTHQFNPESQHSSQPIKDLPLKASSPEDKIRYFIQNYKFRTLNFPLDNDKYPETISSFWIPIEKMKDLYKFNKNFVTNVENLIKKHKIAAWKRSRGDGNCYFRAVISSYFDNIHKPWQSIDLLKSFRNLLKRHRLLDEGYGEYEKAKENILQKVEESIRLKENLDYTGAYSLCANLLQDKNFDIDLVMVARYLTACKLIEIKDDPNISPYVIDGIVGVINNMLCLGNEAGELTLMILPMCLGVQVVQFMFLEKENMVQENFPHEVLVQTMKINVIRREGHYDILYTRQEFEYDMCSLNDGTFTYIESEEFYKVWLSSIGHK
ncbi:hypothetical protein SteCoe_16550 [Stentor coeruleus]|uniref:ubiquitinyl hydrolase 1 n=1 Tax=Stentor coeruleus TaxID=5963 RepID=A0A1R2C125_9CILI|nr:hypothetical protein SteCoe_16550 [Stentor coeruleus]